MISDSLIQARALAELACDDAVDLEVKVIPNERVCMRLPVGMSILLYGMAERLLFDDPRRRWTTG